MNYELEMVWKGATFDKFGLFFYNFPGGTEWYHERSQNNRSAGEDLNLGPPKHGAGLRTIPS